VAFSASHFASEATVAFHIRYSSSIVEKIKRIMGNDPVSINRKHMPSLSVGRTQES
jgi:hypothetical protein